MKSLLDIINGTPSLTPSEVECHKDWLKSLKDRVQPQQEWSEEDEKMIGNIRSIIEKYAFSQSAVDVNGDLCEKEYIEADNWLKSLRPQPKQEWNEEDEKFVHGLIRGLAAKRDIHGHTTFSSDCIDITETINWLKSLRPQSQWKPSERQIYLLNWVANILLKDDGIVEKETAKELQQLLEQLKKLKG